MMAPEPILVRHQQRLKTAENEERRKRADRDRLELIARLDADEGFNAPMTAAAVIAGDKHDGGYLRLPHGYIDDLMPTLEGNEWKILTFICRRTIGWHKAEDQIGLAQFTKGTKCSRRTVVRAIAVLEQRGIIQVIRRKSKYGDDDANVYRLCSGVVPK